MIKIGSVSEMKPSLYDENWLIVRKPDEVPAFVKHEPLLSPSLELFRSYREAYHAGVFDQEFFDQVYVPRFLQDLSENQEALAVLDSLVKKSKYTDILLACYCEDEAMCHRSIIGGVLLGMGAEIDTKPEYKKYYDALTEIRGDACVRRTLEGKEII